MSKAKKIIIIISIISTIIYVAWRVYLKKQGIITTTQEKNNVLIEKTSIGNHVTASSTVPYDIIFSTASEKAGFHIYYPVFIPQGLEIERESIWIGSSPAELDTASFNMGDINSNLPWIAIVQKKIEPNKENSLLTKSLRDKQGITINGNSGFIGTTEGRGVKFNHLILKANDGTAIWLRSKDLNFDTLQKVAQSMR